MTSGPNRSAHRANYTLERGTWHATCRECGFRVSDADRRRAATVYREHIRETNLLPPFVIDLGDTQADLSLPEPLVG